MKKSFLLILMKDTRKKKQKGCCRNKTVMEVCPKCGAKLVLFTKISLIYQCRWQEIKKNAPPTYGIQKPAR